MAASRDVPPVAQPFLLLLLLLLLLLHGAAGAGGGGRRGGGAGAARRRGGRAGHAALHALHHALPGRQGAPGLSGTAARAVFNNRNEIDGTLGEIYTWQCFLCFFCHFFLSPFFFFFFSFSFVSSFRVSAATFLARTHVHFELFIQLSLISLMSTTVVC